MDPDACLDLVIDAAVRGDSVQLRESAWDLAQHLLRGGSPPSDPRR